MKKFSFKEIAVPAVTLFLIAAICTAILAVTDSITADKIAQNNKNAEIQSRQLVFEEASAFSEEKVSGEAAYVQAYDENENVLGYVFTTSAKGYGGEIKIMTGIDLDGKVTGIEILSIEETAGLGMNAKKSEFRNRFVGSTGEFSVVKSDAGKNEIQALTGATITSKAVTDAVNTAVEAFNSVTGGGK